MHCVSGLMPGKLSISVEKSYVLCIGKLLQVHQCPSMVPLYHMLVEWLRERTEHLDIFLFSVHDSMVFYF